MDFLGIGPAELVMIVILLLLFLGPTDVVELFRKFGRMVRKFRASPTWNVINSTAQTLRNLPNTLADEAGMEELRQDLRRSAETSRSIGVPPQSEPIVKDKDKEKDADISTWVTPPPGPSVVPPPSNIRTKASQESSDPQPESPGDSNGSAETNPEDSPETE